MTREEAVELLVNATYSDEWQGNEQLTKANLMAIESLTYQNLSKLNNTCEVDLIRREDALMQARPEHLNPKQEKLASYNQGWNDAMWLTQEYVTPKKELSETDIVKEFENVFQDRRAISLDEIKSTIRGLFE